MVEYKYCNQCGMVKQPDEFYVDRSKADGRRTICKDCDNKDRMTPFAKLKMMLEGNWIFDVFEDNIIGESLVIVDDDTYIVIYSEDAGETITVDVDKDNEVIFYKEYKRPVAAFNFINSVMTRE